MELIIVESPNKIAKIKGYAGPNYVVAASAGHIRDLVTNGEDIGIDRGNGHQLKYVVSDDKKDLVSKLRAAVRQVGPQRVIIATDPDREGEAIGWHLCDELNLDPRTTKRVSFQEITEKAIKAALATPATLDMLLVQAQEGRRAVDRLVGFLLSPVLSRKLAPGLSAGRVQSVAVRLVVEREREIKAFSERFTVPVSAVLHTEHGEPLRATRKAEAFTSIEQGRAYLEQAGRSSSFQVLSVEKKPVERNPSPAFSTSTLQQEGVKKLKFKVQKVSDLAQKLFEDGHVTYIRTDSVNLGEEATAQAEAQITALFGPGHFQARKTKNKEGAQEAHEAIRPTHWENATAGNTPDEQALYRLIYTRALASQMIAAQFDHTTITLAPAGDAGDLYTSSTRVQTRAGFLAVYQEAEEEADGEEEETPTLKNPLHQGDSLRIVQPIARQSYARPPKRYNEATIVADLEKRGIGRPSTYAAILKTIFARHYVVNGTVAGKKLTSQVLTWQNGQLTTSQKSETLGADKDKVLPTESGTQVTEFLEKYFPKVMDYKFTAGCEEIFDKIAQGQQTYRAFVPAFDKNVLEWVALANDSLPDRPELHKRHVGDFEGTDMLVGHGKNGPYLKHADKFYNIPAGVEAATLNEAQAQALILHRRATAPRELGLHQGKPIVVGQGPKGSYVKWNEKYFNVPEGTATASLTLGQAAGVITQAQEQAARDVLATVGKYTIGRNEWGLYVSDGEVKAKFKPGVTEDEATATDAATCADMIKSYKAWKKKNPSGGAAAAKKK